MHLQYISHCYKLLSAKDDCLLQTDGNIKFKGNLPAEEDELTACNRLDLVLDLLDNIGGSAVLNPIFRFYTRELPSESLDNVE